MTNVDLYKGGEGGVESQEILTSEKKHIQLEKKKKLPSIVHSLWMRDHQMEAKWDLYDLA